MAECEGRPASNIMYLGRDGEARDSGFGATEIDPGSFSGLFFSLQILSHMVFAVLDSDSLWLWT